MLSLPLFFRVLIVFCIAAGKLMAASSGVPGGLEVIGVPGGLPTKLVVVAPGAPTAEIESKSGAENGAPKGLEVVIAEGRKNPRVDEGLRQEAAHRRAMTADFTRSLAELERISASNRYAEDSVLSSVIEAVVAALRQDLIYVDAFNTAARGLSVDIVGYPIQSNKMGEFSEGKPAIKKAGVIEGAINLLMAHGKTLMAGKVPDGYAVAQTTITMLGDNSVSVFGNSKAPFLEMAILALLVHVKEKKTFAELGADLSDVMTYRGVAHTSDPSAIASLFAHLDPRCRFRTGNSLLAVHAGFIYGPSDCTAWLTSITGTPAEFRFTTGNLFYVAEFLRNKALFSETGSGHPDIKKWLQTTTGKFLAGNYSPSGEFMKGKFGLVTITNHRTDIKAGHMWHRGAHATLVIGIADNGAIVTLGKKRVMPKDEGFGIDLFPYTSDTNIFEING